MKNAKIVATIWPSSSDPKIFKTIAENIAIARINFSHWDHETHSNVITHIQEDFPEIEILADLQWPKMRVWKFPGGEVQYTALETTTLVYDPEKIDECTKELIYVTQPTIINDIDVWDLISFNDGCLKAKIINKWVNTADIQILNSWELSSNKWLNSSTASFSVNPLTAKDINDLDFISQMKKLPDYVALSFVRTGDDVKNLRKMLDERWMKDSKIIVKIERHEALENLDEIVRETDVVMIARWDLWVEIDIKDLPYYQQEIIRVSKRHRKPTIRATQVLESMRYSPIPTRAEITDLYTAITSWVTYTMLSAESAMWDYTFEAVNLMADMWKKYGNM